MLSFLLFSSSISLGGAAVTVAEERARHEKEGRAFPFLPLPPSAAATTQQRPPPPPPLSPSGSSRVARAPRSKAQQVTPPLESTASTEPPREEAEGEEEGESEIESDVIRGGGAAAAVATAALPPLPLPPSVLSLQDASGAAGLLESKRRTSFASVATAKR